MKAKYERMFERWSKSEDGARFVAAGVVEPALSVLRWLWPVGERRMRGDIGRSGAGGRPAVWPMSRFLSLFPAGEGHVRIAWQAEGLGRGMTARTFERLWLTAKAANVLDWMAPEEGESGRRAQRWAVPARVDLAKIDAQLAEQRAADRLAAGAIKPDYTSPCSAVRRWRQWTGDDLLETLGNRRMTATGWARATREECDMADSTFWRLRKGLVDGGRVMRDADGLWVAAELSGMSEFEDDDDDVPVEG